MQRNPRVTEKRPCVGYQDCGVSCELYEDYTKRSLHMVPGLLPSADC